MTPDLYITQVLFYALLGIPSLICLGVGMYVSVRVVPTLLKQAQRLVDNHERLTEISKESTTGIGGLKDELVKQTTAIEANTEQNKTQGIDFKAYQTLVTDGLHGYEAKLEANTAALRSLQGLLEKMPEQIILGIQDKLACASVLAEFQVLRGEINRAMFREQARSTGTFPSIPTPPPMPAVPPTSNGGKEPTDKPPLP